MRDEASDTMEGGMSDVNEWFSRNMLSVPMLRPVLPPPRSEADFSECYVGHDTNISMRCPCGAR